MREKCHENNCNKSLESYFTILCHLLCNSLASWSFKFVVDLTPVIVRSTIPGFHGRTRNKPGIWNHFVHREVFLAQ